MSNKLNPHKLNLPDGAMPLRRLFNTQTFSLHGIARFEDAYAEQFATDARNIQQSHLFDTLLYRAQVFPPEGYLYEASTPYRLQCRTRQSHSHEVARTARMIANEITQYFPELKAYNFEDICFAAALGHDMGTPPESHTGEETIRVWFKENHKILIRLANDDAEEIQLLRGLAQYEGNANLLRFATARQHMPEQLSCAVLEAMIKYPFGSDVQEEDKPYSSGDYKMGFYSTNSKHFKRIATAAGLKILGRSAGRNIYARHPVAFVVKAADGITYLVHDIVDAMGFNQFNIQEVVKLLRPLNHAPSLGNLAKNNPQTYLNEVCKVLWRTLAKDAAEAFIKNKDAIFTGEYRGDLMKFSEGFSKSYRNIRKTFEARVLNSPEIKTHRAIFSQELMMILDTVTYTLGKLDRADWNANRLGPFPKKLYETLSTAIPNIFTEPNNMHILQSIGFIHMLHYALDAIALVPRDRMIHDVALSIQNIRGVETIFTPVTRKHIQLVRAGNSESTKTQLFAP